MGGDIDWGWLAEAAKRANQGALIEDEQACDACGYSLRGLRVGGVCPECGEPIEFDISVPGAVRRRRQRRWWNRLGPAQLIGTHQRRRQRLARERLAASAEPKPLLKPETTLSQAPIWRIRLLQLGYVLAALGATGGGVGLALHRAGGVGGAAGVWLAAAALWLGGVAVLCAPKPRGAGREEEDWSWTLFRALALTTQSAWLLLAAAHAATQGTLAQGFVLTALVVAVAGLAPTFWLFKRLACWSEDACNGDRIANAGLYLAAGGLLWMAGLRLNMPLLPLFVVALGRTGLPLLGVFLVWAYAWALLQLVREARTASWTVARIRRDQAHAQEERERFERLRALGEQERERLGFGGAVQAPPGSMMGVGDPRKARGHGGPDTKPSPWRR